MKNENNVIQLKDYQEKNGINIEEVEDSNNVNKTRDEFKFDKELIGKVGRGVHSAESLKDFIEVLKNYDDIVFANGQKINGKKVAGVAENIAKDVLSGKINQEESLRYITRTFGLRRDFEKLINKELKKNNETRVEIKNVETFSELYSVLEEAGDIHSTSRDLSPDKWISAIESVKEEIESMEINVEERPSVLVSITNNLGIRDKVKELLIKK